jgi:hypothetical protein
MPKLNSIALLVCAAAVASATVLVSAQDQSDDGTHLVEQITFSPARSASVQQATGSRLRCDLISMTADKVIVRNNQRQNEIEMGKVRSIRSTDGKFEYSPADETFESLLRRCRRIQGVSVGQVRVFDELEPEGPDTANPTEPASTGTAGQPSATALPATGGAAGPAATSPSDSGTPPESADPSPTAAAPNAATAGPARRTSVCANCMKDIPPTLQNGDRCPHCNVIFWDASRPIAPAPAAAGHAAGIASGNPAGNATGRPSDPDSILTARGPKAFSTSTGNVTPVTAPTTDTAAPATTTVGDTFSSMPMWMKVGLFAGMLAIAWLLIQRR